MRLELFQVDSFTNKIFEGNPAGVIFSEFLPNEVMQKIALENNLSETAFVYEEGNDYRIKWFSPLMEIDLCGHATLAAAHIYFTEINRDADSITFISSKNGSLEVTRKNNYLYLNFPVDQYAPISIDDDLINMIGETPIEAFKGRDDIMCIFEDESIIYNIEPNKSLLKLFPVRGLIVSAKSLDYDFVSRCFFPITGVDEDPVTGSAHTTLTPYWAKQLGKDSLLAKQVSSRGGELKCVLEGDRVIIGGEAVTYLKGFITI
ncbi:MAG: PhzF family phenazine biosynthesis protein [SAR86 cluster bacterium]|jgi:PhzF family phenazine biosynthesis protein|uniref:PhzF family phenazine biosynthesis protein n=1 Tax=SAR86 cluster bacterium TaxID=2030880 RepID=A0A937J6G9_9GAMM|nr:PhzF family phenazine biosynthesis protein [SAR86 cluster bacterium]